MREVKVKFAYKAGFRRLWLVLSVILLLVSCLLAWDHPEWKEIMIWLAAVPIIGMYALGVATVWIIEGFARADR